MHIFDVADPAEMTLIRAGNPGYANLASFENGFLGRKPAGWDYLELQGSELVPTGGAEWPYPGAASGIALAGSVLHIVFEDQTIHIFDLSDPAFVRSEHVSVPEPTGGTAYFGDARKVQL